ncbi:MAG: ABC transporter permease [Spirochaetia bacterium]|nr:ABC transporter permease [Spirochaetia bacterium]
MFPLHGILGKWVLSLVNFYGGLLSLLYYSVRELFSSNKKGRYYLYPVILQQIYFTGVQASNLISLIALALGAVVIIGLRSVNQLDLAPYLGIALGLIFVKTLGPLLTAIIVIARSGTAMATEIANMVVRNEILALETLGIDTLKFLVLPRILGMVASIMGLNLIFSIVSILGGVTVAWVYDRNLDIGKFTESLFNYLNYTDIIELVLKAVFFGVGISLVCMINGFKVLLYPGGAPVSGIKGVVGSLQYVFVIWAVLTGLFFRGGL